MPTHGVACLLLRGRRDAPRVALAAGAKVLSRHLERRRVARDAAAAQLERRGKLRGRRVARRRATEHARLEHVEPARGFARVADATRRRSARLSPPASTARGSSHAAKTRTRGTRRRLSASAAAFAEAAASARRADRDAFAS